jgi:hypothetical protein
VSNGESIKENLVAVRCPGSRWMGREEEDNGNDEAVLKMKI